MMAHRMTGIGFYGQPHQITKMLAKVLRRFDLVPLAIQHDVSLADACDHGPIGKMHNWRRPSSDRKARASTARNAKLTGFFLSMVEGRAELHIRIRSTGKGDEHLTGC